MNNQEILQKIVAYIEAIMVDKSMTSRDLAEICAKRSGKMSPRTIEYSVASEPLNPLQRAIYSER